jgi:hypothetical protein
VPTQPTVPTQSPVPPDKDQPSRLTGRLADPEFRRWRAARASAVAWGPDALIKRLARTDLTPAQVATLRTLLDLQDDPQRGGAS